jgi:hypothetical protein
MMWSSKKIHEETLHAKIEIFSEYKFTFTRHVHHLQ